MDALETTPRPMTEFWENFALPKPVGFERVKTGNTNATWIVSLAGAGKVVLRRYGPEFKESALLFEHSLIRHLKENAFPVADILLTKQGESFVESEAVFYALFEYCRGVSRMNFLSRKMKPTLVASAGKLLAWFHELTTGFAPSGHKKSIFDHQWCSDEIRRHSSHIRFLARPAKIDRHFLSALTEFQAGLETSHVLFEEISGRPHRTIIHGDFGPHNLLVQRNQVSTVLDFSSSVLDARISDIAQALISISKGMGATLDFSLAQNFLKAFQDRCPLKGDERSLMIPFLHLRCLILLCHRLKRYYEDGLKNEKAQALRVIQLDRWIRKNEDKIKTLCGSIF